MKRNLLILIIVLITVAIYLSPSVSAQSFSPFFEAVAQLPKSGQNNIKVVFNNNTFRLEILGADNSVAGTAGPYAVNRWSEFIKEAVKNGLVNYHFEKSPLATGRPDSLKLTFLNPTGEQINTGKQIIKLTNRFYNLMRKIPKFSDATGKNGFAVLVVDPHDDIQGRYLLVAALDELIRNNPSIKFKFLVEGEYENAARNIPFNGLNTEFSGVANQPRGNRAKTALTYTLLQRYLIDCPMAYRLLYKDVSSLAIDDNLALRTETDGLSADNPASYNALKRTVRKISEFLRTAKNIPEKDITEDVKLKVARATDVLQAFVHYYRALESSRIPSAVHSRTFAFPNFPYSEESKNLIFEAFKSKSLLSKSETSLQAFKDFLAAVEVLRNIDSNLVSEQESLEIKKAYPYNLYLVLKSWVIREDIMSGHITRESNFNSGYTTISFLGFPHIYQITGELKKQNIGYIVLEPRAGRVAEPDKFQKFVTPSRRQSYINEATKWGNKGPVNPTALEVQNNYKPFLSQGSAFYRERIASEQNLFAPEKQLTVDYEKLSAAMSRNGLLSQSQITVENTAGISPQTQPFDKAFAHFEHFQDGKSSKLTITNAKDIRWTGGDGTNRYKFLEQAPVRYTGNISTVNEFSIDFFQPSGSPTLFASLYNSAQRRYYFFEETQIFDLIADLPRLNNLREILIHLQFAETENLKKQEHEPNGE